MREYFEARKWMSGFELLSLDLVRPVYEHLGVRVSFQETLRGLCRDALLGKYDLQSSPLDATVPAEVVTAHNANIRPALTTFSGAFGEGQLNKLVYWVMYVRESDENPWTPYEEFMSTWARRVLREQYDSLHLTDAKTTAREMRSATAVDDVKALYRTVRNQPISGWDHHLLQKRGISQTSPDVFPYVDEIILTVRMNRFQLYFSHLITNISQRERDAIESGARAFAERNESWVEYFTDTASELSNRERDAIDALVHAEKAVRTAFSDVAHLPRPAP